MEVKAWLESIGLSQYRDAFRATVVDPEFLRELTDEDLIALGVLKKSHRSRFLTAIEALPRVAPNAPRTDFVDLMKLPSVIALPLHEYSSAMNPVLKLWHACDTVELALRLIVFVGLTDMRCQGTLPKKFLADIALRIEEPTLGTWIGMAMSVVEKFAKTTALVPETVEFFQQGLSPLFDGPSEPGTRTPENRFREMRNHLAHGGGVTQAVARRLLVAWGRRFESAMVSAEGLGRMSMVVRAADGSFAELRGPRASAVKFEPENSEVRAALEVALKRGDEVAVVRQGLVMSLWPLTLFGLARGPDPEMGPSTEPIAQIYTRRGEVRLKYTPAGSDEVSQSESDEAAVEAFQEMFGIGSADAAPREARFEVRGFESDIRRDAARLVGRGPELQKVRAALAESVSGVLWVTGQAGMGKSYLMARIARELLQERCENRLVLVYRFKAGDDRCSRVRFLRFCCERLRKWLSLPELVDNRARVQPATELTGLLRCLGDKRVVLLLDGMDEIAELDETFAAEVPLSLAHPGVMWLCAGRPDGGLCSVFSPTRCVHVFPGELPGMSKEDIRTMLMEKIGPLRKRLINNDSDIGDQVVNPFIERIAECAHGLPLYVTYVVGDILSNRYRVLDSRERLPESLEKYHDELLHRYGIGTLQQIVTPIVTSLAVAKEPLSVDQLTEMLRDRTLLAQKPSDPERVRQGLSAAASMLRRASTPEGQAGYTLYHHSIRQHMVQSSLTSDAVEAAQEYFCIKSVKGLLGGSPTFDGYMQRHGVKHLIEGRRYSDAVDLLYHLQERFWQGAAGDAEELAYHARLLSLSLERCPPDEGRALSGERLASILARLDEFEPLQSGIRLLHRCHATDWQTLLDRLLASDNWDVMYTVSRVLAHAFLEHQTDTGIEALRSLTQDTGVNRKQIGFFSFKLIYSRKPELIDRKFLDGLAAASQQLTRGTLCELLLNLAMTGTEVTSLVSDDEFWNPIWEYGRVQVQDVLAAEAFAHGAASHSDLPSDLQAGVQLLQEVDDSRRALLESSLVRESPAVGNLLQKYYDLPQELEIVREAQNALEGFPDLRRLSEVLLAHPAWEVREASAAVVSSFAQFRPEILAWIRELLSRPNWRLRYSAVNMAYFVRSIDHSELFIEAIRRCHGDEHCWVRGISAYTLAHWITGAERAKRVERLHLLWNETRRLLQDHDFWAIEEVYLLVRDLAGASIDVGPLLDGGVSPMLAGEREWWSLGWNDFYDLIETRKRAIVRESSHTAFA